MIIVFYTCMYSKTAYNCLSTIETQAILKRTIIINNHYKKSAKIFNEIWNNLRNIILNQFIPAINKTIHLIFEKGKKIYIKCI